jgi:hypothetical protein
MAGKGTILEAGRRYRADRTLGQQGAEHRQHLRLTIFRLLADAHESLGLHDAGSLAKSS